MSGQTENNDNKIISAEPKLHDKQPKRDKKSPKNKAKIWALKITVITFFLSGVFSLISELTTSNSNLLIAVFIVLLLIIINILFDGIAVAVTACDSAPLLAMAARKISGSKAALFLVKNAEKVNNICADVVGDICGIVSGACGIAIVSKIVLLGATLSEFWITILISSLVAALTVGGKAFVKSFAIKYSKDFVIATAKFVMLFVKEKNL